MLPRHWSELSRDDIAGGRLGEAVAVLPLAAVEQHGPHLPLGVDRFIMQAHLDAVLAAPGEVPFVLLPVQDVGASDEHLAFPGTLSLTPALALPAWTALGEGVHRAGCTRIVLVSSHGGNTPVMDLVAQALRVRFGMIAVTTSWQRLGPPPDFGPDLANDLAHDWHGGFAETSVMLACRPDLVRMDKAADFVSRGRAMEDDYTVLRATRPAGFAWMAQDLHATGALGDASRATAEAGRLILAHAAPLPGPARRRPALQPVAASRRTPATSA
ncbi:creatininase family protein [uncultured Alsobacter sp.]|uniref:creatininase family protein n=1 Tax=uncultured Alsobacter sp. TaxID=1748258 RepID=UPI00345DB6F0